MNGSGVVRTRINSDTNAGIRLSIGDTGLFSVAAVKGTGEMQQGTESIFQIYNESLNKNALTIGASSSQVDIYGSTSVHGNFSVVGGTKQFVEPHPTDPTKVIAYVSLEGPEAGTYIRGTAQLVNGEAVVNLPEHFSLVTNEAGLTIQLTPRGEWLQLYVVKASAKQIIVREARGKSGQFDYLVQGVRKGYENHQVIQDKVK